ncbi:nuclease-related domain-containing DEAD/DEAH box helicase [Corallococcus sp. M7]
MARIVPEMTEEELVQHKPAVEAQVYRAFRDRAPADWFVFFSLRIVKQVPRQTPELGELDFVIFCPRFGLLVVEVKGGIIEIDDAAKTWTSIDAKGGRHVISDPLHQAASGLKQLTTTFKREIGWSSDEPHYLLAGTALLFPDVSDVTPLAGLSRPLSILGGAGVLREPEKWVHDAFHFWAKDNDQWRPLGPGGVKVAESLFAKRIFVPRPLASLLRGEHARQIELTRQQGQVLRALKYHPRACVVGAAGTGKTLLALEQARYFAAQGLRTLFVCFNRALSDFLFRECQGAPGLDALTFHMLCSKRLSAVKKERGFDLMEVVRAERRANGEDSEDVLLAYALARSTEEHSFRYQAVVVDEGQDFVSAAFLGFRKLLENPRESPWLIFYDPNQAIYRKLAAIPSMSASPYPLTLNCRNTQPIHRAAYAFFRGDDPADSNDVAGGPIELLGAEGLAAQAVIVRQKVEELVNTHGLDPGSVVVLVAGDPKDSFYNALRGAGPPVGSSWSFEQHFKKGVVVVDTARRFKGLEAVTLILWGVEYVPLDIAREILYVSLSRARSRLWIVGHPQRMRDAIRASAVDVTSVQDLL